MQLEHIRELRMAAATGALVKDNSAMLEDAVVSGFKSHNRRAVWPLLAGVSLSTSTASTAAALATVHGAVSRQYTIDAERGMHFDICKAWSPSRREQCVSALACVLELALGHDRQMPGCPCYYQGLHDIAAVLMLELGPSAAVPLLKALLQSRLAGFAAPTMDCSVSVLNVMWRLFEAVDPALHARCVACSVQPVFALSWVLTWFSHDLQSFGSVARLFDLLLGGHPLMVAYVAVAILHTYRAEIMTASQSEDASLYTMLQKLPQRLDARPTEAARAAGLSDAGASPGHTASAQLATTSPSSLKKGPRSVQAKAQQVTAINPGDLDLAAEGKAHSQPSEATGRVIALAVAFFRLCPPHVLLASCPRPALLVLHRDWPLALEGTAICSSLTDAPLAQVIPPFDPLRNPFQLMQQRQQRQQGQLLTRLSFFRMRLTTAMAVASRVVYAVGRSKGMASSGPVGAPAPGNAGRCAGLPVRCTSWYLRRVLAPVVVALGAALLLLAMYRYGGPWYRVGFHRVARLAGVPPAVFAVPGGPPSPAAAETVVGGGAWAEDRWWLPPQAPAAAPLSPPQRSGNGLAHVLIEGAVMAAASVSSVMAHATSAAAAALSTAASLWARATTPSPE